MVGKAPGADLRLDDPYVSARHARIRVDSGRYSIEDLGSTNGTFVDGVRVERAWLAPGTAIRVGNQRLVIAPADATKECSDAVPSWLVGASPAFVLMRRTLERLANLRLPVLLHGETGTGKELAARLLHQSSTRADRPLVAVNCAAIPEGIAESELFGHARGAFTGAHRPHVGAFVRSHGGTLFLDEVAELPLPLQAKLLRVIETGCVLPVGSEQEVEVDVRIVSATHRGLESMVEAGLLREDLYHRLGVFVVELPALRERTEDIPALLEHFAAEAGRELGIGVSVCADAVSAASRYSWPGNIRALRNAVFRAAALAEGPVTAADLLPRWEGPQVERRPGEPASRAPVAQESSEEEEPVIELRKGDYRTMRRCMLTHVVREEGSIRRAARVLGVPRSTLGAWLKR